MTPVRFGLVGYGFGARYFHAPLIVAAPDCELVGVMTSSPERQALVAREIPGTSTFSSLAALVDAGAEAVPSPPQPTPTPASPSRPWTSAWPSSATSRSRSIPMLPDRQ